MVPRYYKWKHVPYAVVAGTVIQQARYDRHTIPIVVIVAYCEYIISSTFESLLAHRLLEFSCFVIQKNISVGAMGGQALHS